MNGKTLEQAAPAFESQLDVPRALQRLSNATLDGQRWQREFGMLRQALTAAGAVHPVTPSVIPGLLALAHRQPKHRAEYLGFLELCQCLRPVEPAREAGLLLMAQVQAEIAAGDASYRAFLTTDPAPEVRASAARLLRRSPERTPETRRTVEWALSLETQASVQEELLAALHVMWERPAGQWAARLSSYMTPRNAPGVRVRAACCRLACATPMGPESFDELKRLLARNLYGPSNEFPGHRLLLIREAASRLGRERAVDFWSELLPGMREFDGAVDVSLQLLRAAFRDERRGWEEMSLSVRHKSGQEAEPPNLLSAIGRLAWAAIHQRLTGRFPLTRLRKDHRPCRDYVAIRAFPPALDLTDPGQLRAVQAIARAPGPWLGFTNLWKLFGLPSRRLEMQMLINDVAD